jgi:hypothetical protein
MSKIETLRQALRDVLAQYQADRTLPTSARFLYYELVAAGVVSKHATGARRADQGVIDALKSLRDRGEIPWDWIVDEARVLYLGDFDLAGADIEANTRRVLERNRNRDLDWERLALTREQVALYSLPVITKSDGRFANGGTHDAVETEALSQLLIVQIVRDRLNELLPAPLADFAAAEATERERVRALLGGAAD